MLNYIKSIILAFFVILGLNTFSQTEPVIDTSSNVLLLKEMSFGVIFHSQGWGIKFNKGYNKTAFTKRVLEFEMVEIQSPKQIRTINPYFTNSKSYIYGKLNTVFVFRGSYGMHKLLNRKPYWGGVELRFFYMGGASLGITKPIYLYILNASPIFYEYTITEEKYDPENHFIDNIFGRAPFTRGFNELSVYPGLNAKVGLDFDYGVYRTKVKSLEIGAIFEFFPRAVPIMAFNDPEYFFLTFYLNFNFGKRYNN
ncbi:MAG: hypothetical protein JW731_04955 [Bacteroidales bacterium]|nr:hypothetical protein [Bacteroidales bacterium]